jgi:hypothetical protein
MPLDGKRGMTMRDELDLRGWTAHHETFSASVDNELRALARWLKGIDLGRAPAAHLIAAVLATSLTLVGVGLTTI